MRFLLAAWLALSAPQALADEVDDFEYTDRCIVLVTITSLSSSPNRDFVDRFCEPFGQFCHVRRHRSFWEGSFRYVTAFEGVGFKDTWGRYETFIRKSLFDRSGFNHSFQFRGCHRAKQQS